jgi:hypothetical protein
VRNWRASTSLFLLGMPLNLFFMSRLLKQAVNILSRQPGDSKADFPNAHAKRTTFPAA